ncbi:MAG: hypothetical protein JNK23_08905 [Opitutaceae bacterium]|nr:hypothetical protein [Opitutaceae bacterium]
MKPLLLPALAITLGVAALLAADAAPRTVAITLPAETARLADSPLPGAALATSFCFTCHSADYVLTQPPASSRAYWKNTVVKMQKTFGAPIPDSAIDPITDYLVKTYGAERASGK